MEVLLGLCAFIYALPSRNPDRKEQLSGALQSGAHHLPRPTHAPRQVLPAPWDPPPDLSLPPPARRGQAGPVTVSLKSRRGRASHCMRHVCTQVASLPQGTRHGQLLSSVPVGQLGSSAGLRWVWGRSLHVAWSSAVWPCRSWPGFHTHLGVQLGALAKAEKQRGKHALDTQGTETTHHCSWLLSSKWGHSLPVWVEGTPRSQYNLDTGKRGNQKPFLPSVELPVMLPRAGPSEEEPAVCTMVHGVSPQATSHHAHGRSTHAEGLLTESRAEVQP